MDADLELENSYQRAVDEVGDHVVVGGSEHALFTFATSTFDRLTGHIMVSHGDIQRIADGGGVLYAGCHCNQFNYTNAYTWPSIGTGLDPGRRHRVVRRVRRHHRGDHPQLHPDMTMRRGSGIWGIVVDSRGKVWAGATW